MRRASSRARGNRLPPRPSRGPQRWGIDCRDLRRQHPGPPRARARADGAALLHRGHGHRRDRAYAGGFRGRTAAREACALARRSGQRIPQLVRPLARPRVPQVGSQRCARPYPRADPDRAGQERPIWHNAADRGGAAGVLLPGRRRAVGEYAARAAPRGARGDVASDLRFRQPAPARASRRRDPRPYRSRACPSRCGRPKWETSDFGSLNDAVRKSMADAERKLNDGKSRIDFQTDPSKYRHWKLKVDGDVATLLMDVDEKGTLFEGYELKLNSYDLGVDIELADAIERLRFEHPQVKVILLRSGKPRVFCAGANIRMLAGATHAHKVNFCKFTNETRNGIEDASEASGLFTICVINGTAAGGGYELALAADHIMLIDDGSSAVSLPELPLLAVLPGTGGLTRVTDKRKVRRDRADVFCTTEEGVKGKRAVEWRLVDEAVPGSKLEETVAKRAQEFAARSRRPGAAKGIALTPLERERSANGVEYGSLSVELDREARLATVTLRGPQEGPPASAEAMVEQGARFWPLALARDLDDAMLDIRANEFEVAAIVFKSLGDPAQVLAYEAFLDANKDQWLAREIRGLWKRTLKRVDLTSRSLVALIEHGSCFAGTLAELVFATDRSYMLIGQLAGDNKPPASIV